MFCYVIATRMYCNIPERRENLRLSFVYTRFRNPFENLTSGLQESIAACVRNVRRGCFCIKCFTSGKSMVASRVNRSLAFIHQRRERCQQAARSVSKCSIRSYMQSNAAYQL